MDWNDLEPIQESSKPRLRITRARCEAAMRSTSEIPKDIFDHWMALGVSGYTYFARGLETGRIKIGRSKDPWHRRTQLASSNNGENAELICVLRGLHFEKKYHRQFADHLDACEWFNPHPEILAEIARLNSEPSA